MPVKQKKKEKRGPYQPRHNAVGLKGIERVFICDYCEKKFNRKNNLKQHFNVHLQEKLLCLRCGQYVSKKSHLKRHIMNVHQNSFTPINKNQFLFPIKVCKKDDDEYYSCPCKKDSSTCDDRNCPNVCSKIECSPKLCSTKCQNQNFRKGLRRPFYTKMTKEKGYGLFAGEDIEKNQFMIEYIGEVINEKQFQKRQNEAIKNGETCFYHVKLGKKSYIDSRYFGNLSRFINHSCDPNSRLEMWTTYDEHYGEQTSMAFFSNEKIKAHDEITFDYNWKTNNKCLCESKKCRNIM